MNHTLEAIARAIFKSWFVDFGPVRAKMEGEQMPMIAHRAKKKAKDDKPKSD